MNIIPVKTPLDTILQIIALAKKIKETEDKTQLPELFALITHLTDSEVLLIHRQFDSDEFSKELDKIRAYVQIAKNRKSASALNKIIKLEKTLYQKVLKKFHEFDHYKLGVQLGSGAVGAVYELKSDRKKVIKIFSYQKDEDTLAVYNAMRIRCASVSSTVNIPKVILVGYYNLKPAFIMERCPGIQIHERHSTDYGLWSRMIKSLSNAPQSHYNKLISDYQELISKGFWFELKPGNMMYDKKTGFWFIDYAISGNMVRGFLHDGISNIEPSFERVFVNLTLVEDERVTPDDRKNIRQIFLKLKSAGLNLEYARGRWEMYGIEKIP